MRPMGPSVTAWAAASHRAAHQLLEGGRIFADPLAVPMLGLSAAEVAAAASADPARRGMRLFIAARTRFAEDALARAVANGASQLVVLGAGLDTFAYRNPFAGDLLVFEVGPSGDAGLEAAAFGGVGHCGAGLAGVRAGGF